MPTRKDSRLKPFIFIFVILFFHIFSYPASSEPQSVVYEVLNEMEKHVITKNSIDWEKLREHVDKLLTGTPTTQQEEQAVYYLLKETDTNHSFYRRKGEQRVIMHSNLNCRREITDNHTIAPDIGYIRVDSYSSSTRAKNDAFAQSIQEQIKEQDEKPLRGWIVDLRRNSGGNMWPMLAGLSSLLGDSTQGAFIMPDGTKQKWGTYKGRSVLNNHFIAKAGEPYSLNNARKPIAVLSSSNTASSGEAVLIAFKHLPNTRFFGQKSCGQTTANRKFEMSNGDLLFLTTSKMADKRSLDYPNGVEVDEPSSEPLFTAEKWVYSH